MTQQEFKAWFDGFTENIETTPTKKQWTRIQERVREIDGTSVTYTRYIHQYAPYYQYPYYSHGVSSLQGSNDMQAWAANAQASSVALQHSFDSLSAMNSLGSDEAQNL